ncbi:tRNA1(Val) (adenine(37)-N6)-methyltransferase [Vagococcus elongatus]|uniref:SAM-dependent methyltransferase n=1 Tax=Vagococcus elongatus TaxID=180344 RepID=A0A430B4P5_9ENTE|nr:tRNA1(Val) (adenine(37)-N6)-methyltransferase [Vagococcus elongatus]RSU15294.1 SAM-dependent methyltransferase [Vagococcus elongatus]
MIYSNERVDQLVSKGVQIIQSPEVFSFSLDAVLLAHFAKVPKKGVIVDLCAGNGAVGLFISQKTNGKIIGVELQERLADMAKRSIQLNDLEEQMDMLAIDLKETTRYIPKDSVDLVVCNPPYFKELPTNTKNPNPHLAIARHELHTNLEEVIAMSAGLLKMNGKFSMVHRPERLVEILQLMDKHLLTPKRLQFIYPKKHKEANVLLIEGIRNGKSGGLKILPPLYVYNEDNQYLPEVAEMLYGK